MKVLKDVVKRLNSDEILLLKKQLKNNPQKLKLFKYVIENDKPDENTIMKILGYSGKNNSAFYTIKHRLISKIKEINNANKSNELTEILKRISNLRTLLYSRNQLFIEREIKDLKKKAKEMDLFKSLPEVIFCDYLFHYTDQKTRENLSGELDKSIHNEALFKSAEFDFYRIILQYQDLFFDPGYTTIHPVAELYRIEQAHKTLDSKTTEFFLLSSKLTLVLRCSDKFNDVEGISNLINRLTRLYQHPHLMNNFPDCSFAIECLHNRFYLLTDRKSEFEDSMNKLDRMFDQIEGYRMYNGPNFYYCYIKIFQLCGKGSYEEAHQFLKHVEVTNNQVDDNLNFSNKIQYLRAVIYQNQGSYTKSRTALFKAKNDLLADAGLNLWMKIENSLLIVLILLNDDSIKLAEAEFKYLKKLVGRDTMVERFKPLMKALSASIRQNNVTNFNVLIHECNRMKMEHKICMNVNFVLFGKHKILENVRKF